MIKEKIKDLPNHLAIMIDGNRRWAEAKNLPSFSGHKVGIRRVIEIIKYAKKKGIKVFTLYGFSTENWKRSSKEVNYLMKLFTIFAKKYASQFKNQGIKFCHLGDLQGLPLELQKAIKKACSLTKNNKEMVLNIALNYGGRDEITRTVKKIVQKKISAKKITEQLIMANLDTKGLPDVDFIIRTSGEMRMSNFLPLQATYAELYFPKTCWPDFDPHQLDLALEEFKKRQRRFGQ
ncbi:MAG: polyprenyl diphosphate synthase [Candidatus Paceibacterota bacterium]|jgi:undecaprenyl diphosphate synthase